MSALGLVILGLLTAVPPASGQQGSTGLGQPGVGIGAAVLGAGSPGVEGVAFWPVSSPLAPTLWRGSRDGLSQRNLQRQTQASVCDLFPTSEKWGQQGKYWI